MSKCIFCLTTDESLFNTREHILPESLGGGNWAILPKGLYCDRCQNKFGSSIEQQALADYPFSNMRTVLGIPTKKRKAPWFEYWEGKMYAGQQPGEIIFEPNDFFKPAIESGQKTMTIVPMITRRPDMTLRMLLKIGLEVIAAKEPSLVFNPKFDPARNYALHGTKDYQWFYILREDYGMLNRYLKDTEWPDYHHSMDVYHEANGLVHLHLRILYLQFLVPLVENVVLDPKMKITEPEEKVFFV